MAGDDLDGHPAGPGADLDLVPDLEVDADVDVDAEADAEEPVSGAELARRALADARAIAAGRAGDGSARVATERARRRRQRNRQANLGGQWSGPGADRRDPAPLAAVLRGLIGERGWAAELTVARLFSDWASLVGPDVAANATPLELRDGELRISARSSAWATQLRLLAPTLLARLATQLGAGIVKSVTIVGPSGPSWKHGRRSVPGARGPRDTYG